MMSKDNKPAVSNIAAGRRRRIIKISSMICSALLVLALLFAVSPIFVYDALFPRYERPDYDLYPGMYCYERYEGILDREELTVPSGNVDLAAYYYPVAEPMGLVIMVHGFHAGADDYLPLIYEMVQANYAVFAYDATGVYSSGGDSGVGMCQQLVDLDAVLDYIGQTAPYSEMPVLLVGHSWGGYAAASVLELHSEVKACVCIAPMSDGSNIMVETSEAYIGKLAYLAKPAFDLHQKHLFGEYTKYNAIRGINATKIPVLIAQGQEDSIITSDHLSVTGRLDEIHNPNVTVYYGTGLQGTHSGIWHSAEAEKYAKEVDAEKEKLEAEMGRELTISELETFYDDVDHKLYSEVNHQLLSLIFQTFEKGLLRQSP